MSKQNRLVAKVIQLLKRKSKRRIHRKMADISRKEQQNG